MRIIVLVDLSEVALDCIDADVIEITRLVFDQKSVAGQ